MARRRKMDPERKAFISSLLEHYQPKDAQDIQDMLKDLLGETLQGMLEAEMDDQMCIRDSICICRCGYRSIRQKAERSGR